jgi:predicted ATPase
LAEDLVESEGTAFADGVYYVPLTALQTAEGVAPAVAEALGYSSHTDAEGGAASNPRQQLLEYLRRKRLLLVLDNYEHLLVEGTQPGGCDSGTAFLSDILSVASGVKALVTSRASLQIQGEHLYQLAGLRVPEVTLLGTWPATQAARGYSAVELFIHRAGQVRSELEWEPQDLVHIAEICRLVQGMPLAILLAAAWVGILTPKEIAAEIQQSLDFLETDLRDVPPRQRSMRATFDHSWRLLSEREQELLLELSVFRGGFAREAAQEVAGASLRDLKSLVDKSLLHPTSPGRYELHELLRQYAAERLDAAPQHREAVRDRHCAYYCAALERWAGELKGARQREATAEMRLGIEDARAAWRWAASHRQVARLAQAVDGMWLYHESRMRYGEAEAAFRTAVQALEAVDSGDAQRLRAKCLVLWSQFQIDLVWRQPSIEAAEQALDLLRNLEAAGQDVRHEMALALFQKARLKTYGRLDLLEARNLYAQSVALYEAAGDRWSLARGLALLGWMTEQVGELAEAQALCQRSLAIRQELGDQRGVAEALLYLGVITWVQGQPDEALGLFQESLEIFRTGDDRLSTARSMKWLGEMQVRLGRYEDGLALMQSCADIFDDLVHPHGLSGLLPFLAEAKVHLGRYAEARADAAEAVARARRDNHRWAVGFSLFVQGLAVLAEGAPGEALHLFQESVAVMEEIRHRENRGWVAGPLGMAALAAGETALARRSILEALQVGVELRAFMPMIYGLPAAALLLAGQGAAERAVEAYACASRYAFVANSRWFDDLVVRPEAAAAALLPAGPVGAARERGRTQGWYGMAAQLLAELQPL